MASWPAFRCGVLWLHAPNSHGSRETGARSLIVGLLPSSGAVVPGLRLVDPSLRPPRIYAFKNYFCEKLTSGGTSYE